MGHFLNLLQQQIRIPLPGEDFTAGAVYRNAGRLYLESLIGGMLHRRKFRHLESFCLFAGYSRSGQSLLGSCLDAHPEMLMAHEGHALELSEKQFNRHQIFHHLLANSVKFAKNGRGWSGYSYAIPGQWQGKFSALKIIGDKRNRGTLNILLRRWKALEEFRRRIGLPVKIVHVVRNPFDAISRQWMLMKKADRIWTRDYTIYDFFAHCNLIPKIQAQSPENFLRIRLEDFIADPKPRLRDLCSFLGCGAEPDYLEACAQITQKEPHQTRRLVQWPPEQIARIEKKMRRHEFLRDYSFEGI